MYIYLPEVLYYIIGLSVFVIVYVIGWLSGVSFQKKRHKTINITLKNGNVREVEEINKIINEVFEQKVKEL